MSFIKIEEKLKNQVKTTFIKKEDICCLSEQQYLGKMNFEPDFIVYLVGGTELIITKQGYEKIKGES